MTYHEKKSLVNILTTFLVYGIYYTYVYQAYQDLTMTTDEQLQFWGKTLLIAIPITIGAKIIVHIGFTIMHTMITQEKHPGMEDERDKLIELKSTRNSFFFFGIGFLSAMIAIASGYPIQTMFIMLICGGFSSELFENLSKLIYYRRGI